MLAVTDPATGVRRVRDGVRAQRGRRRRRAHPLVAHARVCASTPRSAAARRGTCASTASSTDRELVAVRDRVRAPVGAGRLRTPAPDDARARRVPPRRRAWGGSTIVDLSRDERPAPRRSRDRALSPNANMMHPHTVVPALDDDRAGRDALVGVRGRRVPRRGRGRARARARVPTGTPRPARGVRRPGGSAA